MNQRLITDIETAMKRRLTTPRDFELLHDRIFARLNENLSATTLMRLWGYIDEPVTPRRSTLNILARFLGYRDFDDYSAKSAKADKESDPVMSRRVNVASDLRPGDCLLLTWLPDRECHMEYLGHLNFRVTDSLNTRLQPGDTFQCGIIIENEPLYLDNLRQNRFEAPAYVCGKKNGVRFELLKKK